VAPRRGDGAADQHRRIPGIDHEVTRELPVGNEASSVRGGATAQVRPDVSILQRAGRRLVQERADDLGRITPAALTVGTTEAAASRVLQGGVGALGGVFVQQGQGQHLGSLRG
jgi:hypothetical protein